MALIVAYIMIRMLSLCMAYIVAYLMTRLIAIKMSLVDRITT
jgi:hypothetical protein